MYLRLLERWIKSAVKDIYPFPDRNELACYGTGYNNWGVQTNQKAFAAFAVLAAAPDLDEKETGVSREEINTYALKMLRFSLESHIEGSYHCADNTKWGHTWISALGIERMMHGIDAIRDSLSETDKKNIRKVIISECDWLTDHYEVVASLYAEDGNNRPESNLWNGALLYRAAAMFPDTPRAGEYRKKGTLFLLNSISVPSDGESLRVISGKPLREWHKGTNFFESYALNHHSYLNVGYMIICLSNAAMLHFMFEKNKTEAPEALYHHVRDLWMLVKNLTFPDGRLIRIGGDTCVRYCYCQDYAIPAWLMMNHKYGDSGAAAFENGWLKTVQKEQKNNGDGSFLSERCASLKQKSPLYYTRLESDRAVTLSMGAYWRRIFNIPGEAAETGLSSPEFFWHDKYHGACFRRDGARIVSWVWNAAQQPQGLCLSPEKSDMAEWRQNLAGEICGVGKLSFYETKTHFEKFFEKGFITSGTAIARSCAFIAEGQADENMAEQKITFAALPDGQTVLIMQYAKTLMRCYLDNIKGLLLNIPNDIFNGNRRTYFFGKNKRSLRGYGSRRELLDLKSKWINIDDNMGVIGVYGAGSFQLFRPGSRRSGIKFERDMGDLFVDELCFPFIPGQQSYSSETVLFDIGCIIRTGENHKETFKNNAELKSIPHMEDLRFLAAESGNGKKYLMVKNISDKTVSYLLRLPCESLSSLTEKRILKRDSKGAFKLSFDPNQADLFLMEI